jgi:O-antigen/teichoic acid export membrane protein
MKAVHLGTQIRQISIITVLVGFVSYAFNFVVARVLIPDDAARVMTSWTVINLSLLIIQFPLELYGPRLLRSMAEQEKQEHFDTLVLLYIGATSVISFVLFLFYYGLRYRIEVLEVGVFGVLIASFSLFQLFRTINIAKENLRGLVRSSIFLAFGSLCFFSLVFFLDITSTNGPLLAVTLGFTWAGLINVQLTDITLAKVKLIFQNRDSFLEIFSFREIGALSLSNLVSLLLVPGGAIFTGIVGLTTEETVVYLGSMSLALIPMTILNSTTMPIYLRAINLFTEKKMTQFRILFVKSALVYSVMSLSVVVSFWLVGEKVLLAFLGDSYQYSQSVFVFSSVAVCLSFVGSLPRLFLMAMNKTRQIYGLLMLTLLLYLVLVLLIRNGHVGLFVASIGSSVFISTTTFFKMHQNIQFFSRKVA